MTRLVLVSAVAAALLAGCGGGAGHGSATLWVTRDEGRSLLISRTVPAGESVLQALERTTTISTRYGGHYVQSIDGLAGSIDKRHDWFFFVNGVEGDRGAADYRLRGGDVAWWDYRDWGRYGMSVPAVVGAFPEPFVHGYDGTVRTTIVVGPATPVVEQIAKLVHAARVAPPGTTRMDAGVNTLRIEPGGAPRFTATWSGGTVHVVYRGDPARLLHDPALYRRRYRLP